MGGVLCISMFLINKNKLNSDFKKISPAKWLVLSHTSYFTVIGKPLDLTIYTGTPVVFYCLKFLYWQH